MPIVPVLAPPPGMIIQAQETVQRQTVQIDQEFRAEAESVRQDYATGDLIFSGGVKAVYGPSVIECGSLRINRNTDTGVAEGGVVLSDPEGSVRCDRLEFDWSEGAKTGFAENPEIQVGYVRIQAKSIRIRPGFWTLEGASFTVEDINGRANRIIAETVDIVPGSKGTAKHVFVQFLGQKIGPLPQMNFNLDKRVSGFKLPNVSNRQGVGFGINWDSSFLVSKNSALSGSAGIFPKTSPSYQMTYSVSGLGEDADRTKIEVKDDLAERFQDGWFNFIGIDDPEHEWNGFKSKKRSFSVQSAWNVGVTARPVEAPDVSKMLNIGYEYGEPVGDYGFRVSANLQRIRASSRDPWVDRFQVSASLGGTPVSLGDSLFWTNRIDLESFLSQNTTFGFVRFETGIVTKDLGGVRLGAGYTATSSFGTPDFAFDGTTLNHGLLMRADYTRGPYTVRYLAKYDLDNRMWYDREWELALAAGAFEPYIVKRQFPQEYRLGVRFRLDDLFDRLQQREVKREKG